MKYLTSPLEDMPWVTHGFFTRQGGVSGGIYASLNCGPGSGDDPDSVAANRGRVAETLGVENVASLHQIHSAKAVVAAQTWDYAKKPQADAIVTAAPGIGAAVLTADCVPVLFASKKERIVAAAHAGWKGALGGVLEAAIKEMQQLGARDIRAAIGPCIGPLSYEVTGEFLLPFLEHDKDNIKFFSSSLSRPAGEGVATPERDCGETPSPRPSPAGRERGKRYLFDLPGYVGHRLKAAGITHVYDTRQDTLPNEAAYFSYRRTTLGGMTAYGRQISVIGIRSGR